MAKDATPDAGGPQEEPPASGIVETTDGTEHVGVLPASAALSGWFRSPSGHPTHAADRAGQVALAARGYEPISEDQAKELVAQRAELQVDRADVAGTFDDDTVKTAVRNEAPTPRARRRRTG